jgi:hypothetical protein
MAESTDTSQQHVLQHDFGLLRPGQKVAYRFPIANPTEKRWTFAGFKTSCTCTITGASAEAIDAGKTESVEVVYVAPGKSADVRQWVGVRFAEPDAPFIRLEIRANVREPVTAQPAELRFARVGKGQPLEAALEIYNYSEAAFSGITLRPTQPWLTVHSLQAVEPSATDQALRPRQAWRAVVRMATGGLPTGSNTAALDVQADDGAGPGKSVPVELCVASPVDAIPAQFFFGRVAPGKPVTHRVAFHFTPGAAPPDPKDAVLSHDLGPGLTLNWAKVHSERWDLVATFTAPPEKKGQTVEGLVKVTFRGGRLPECQLPVLLRVEDG